MDDGDKLYIWDTGGRLTEVKQKPMGNVLADYAYDEVPSKNTAMTSMATELV